MNRCVNCNGLRHSPALANGLTYVGGDRLAAVDPTDGAERWTFETGPPTASRPVVRTESVFIVSAYSNGMTYLDERVSAVDAQSGEQRWQAAPGETSQLRLVGATDESVFVTDVDDAVGRGENTYALNSVTGAEQWRYDTGDVYSPGIITQESIILDAPHGLLALDRATGEQRWLHGSETSTSTTLENGILYAALDGGLSSLDPTTGRTRWNYELSGTFVTQFDISGDVAYAGTYDGQIISIDVASGDQRWRVSPGEQVWSLSVTSDLVYAGFSSQAHTDLAAFSVDSGARQWRYRSDDQTGVNTVSVGRAVYAYHHDQQTLVALTRDHGEELWAFSPGGDLTDTVITGETLFVGSGDGFLYAIDA